MRLAVLASLRLNNEEADALVYAGSNVPRISGVEAYFNGDLRCGEQTKICLVYLSVSVWVSLNRG